VPSLPSASSGLPPDTTDTPDRALYAPEISLHATGDVGAILRHEGLYSSALTDRRKQRDGGAFGALTPAKRDPKTAEPNPLTADLARLQRDNARFTLRLKRAEAIIELQKSCGAAGHPAGPELEGSVGRQGIDGRTERAGNRAQLIQAECNKMFREMDSRV
jgi:transposase